IFDRFERAISYEYISGLGLGLYISKQIAEAHGGRISVNSAPGEGAEFTFEIPARRAAS
ncbi:MAG: ATP-binding protein, partial [Proteobacteria bacterium]